MTNNLELKRKLAWSQSAQWGMNSVCPNPACRNPFDISRHLVTVPSPTKPGIDEVVSRCPKCKSELLMYYTNAEVERLRQQTHAARLMFERNRRDARLYDNWRAAQEALKKAHDELNAGKKHMVRIPG